MTRFAAGKPLRRPDTKITLNNSEDGLNLFWPNNEIVDSLAYKTAPINQSYNRTASPARIGYAEDVAGGWQWSASLTPGTKNTILETSVKGSAQSLLNPQKSDNNNEIEAGAAALSQGLNQEVPDGYPKNQNPWFLFFTALLITIISGSIVLFIRFRFKNLKI